MIAVLFEAKVEPACQARYLQLAAELKPLLAEIDGFIDIERFQSLTNDGKILSSPGGGTKRLSATGSRTSFTRPHRPRGESRFLATTAYASRRWCGNILSKQEVTRMYDVHVIFNDVPGELARFGQLLGRSGVGLEGGGVFGVEAHFLVEEGKKQDAFCLRPGLRCVRCAGR
jgi:hypothetical protein